MPGDVRIGRATKERNYPLVRIEVQSQGRETDNGNSSRCPDSRIEHCESTIDIRWHLNVNRTMTHAVTIDGCIPGGMVVVVGDVACSGW